MGSGSYSLATTVSFLEAVLNALGHQPAGDVVLETRESLRERFRRVARLLKRFRAEQGFQQGSLSISTNITLAAAAPTCWKYQQRLFGESYSHQVGNCLTASVLPLYEAQAGTWADLHVSPRFYGSQAEFDDLPPPTPVFPKAAPTIFDVAMRVAVDGITCVYAAVMDLWSRRHDVVVSAASNKQKPQRRLALDRLFLALMRFALGFFGSHKVDARNNP